MLPSTFLEVIDFPLWLLPVIPPPFNVQCQISWGESLNSIEGASI
jgi:hypothetical protein